MSVSCPTLRCSDLWVRPDLVAEIAFAEVTAEKIVRHASFLGLREDKAAREVRREEAMPTSEAQRSIRISNHDRLIFLEAKITKGELAEYYARMGAAMLPWIARRPIRLGRCPQGRAKK